MNVLVAGGTGFIGRHLCAELLDRDHDVTALARTPETAAVPDGVETVMGDVSAYDSIESAFAGRDAVVNLVALSPLFEPSGGNQMHDRVHRRGTEHCVQAATEHGVDRFLQMSALGADPDGPTHYIRAKGRAEQVVRDSALSWTIVRPSVVFGDGGEFLSFTRKLTPPVIAPLPGGGTTRFQPIHIDDLVPMLADGLADEHAGQTYEIGGPEQLELAEVARLVREARGQPVHILPVPMALASAGLSVAGAIPGVPFGPDQYRALQSDNVTADNGTGAFGVSEEDMLTVAEYLGLDER
jgi:NADH dehydrogenase